MDMRGGPPKSVTVSQFGFISSCAGRHSRPGTPRLLFFLQSIAKDREKPCLKFNMAHVVAAVKEKLGRLSCFSWSPATSSPPHPAEKETALGLSRIPGG